jgi:hypothetical protein
MGVTRISSHIAQNPLPRLALFCSQRSLATMVTQANCDMAVDRHRSEALSPTVLLSSPSSVSFQNNFVPNEIVEVATVEIVKVMTTIGPYKSFT